MPEIGKKKRTRSAASSINLATTCLRNCAPSRRTSPNDSAWWPAQKAERPTSRLTILKLESSGYLQAPSGKGGDRLSKKWRLQIPNVSDVVDMVQNDGRKRFRAALECDRGVGHRSAARIDNRPSN